MDVTPVGTTNAVSPCEVYVHVAVGPPCVQPAGSAAAVPANASPQNANTPVSIRPTRRTPCKIMPSSPIASDGRFPTAPYEPREPTNR